MSLTIPATLAKLLRLRRPHGGVGEGLAQEIVMDAIRDMKVSGLRMLRDSHGNIEVLVGNHPEIVFTSHLDTVHRDDGQQVLFVIETTGEVVADGMDGMDGKPSVLGADDAAGVYLMLELIRARKHGKYLFFVGEECGGLGSAAYIKDNPTFSANMVVSFDRRGDKDIITHQGGYCTASTEFAQALANQLNSADAGFEYRPSSGGLFTDSRQFAAFVPECTNIAVGYANEHTIHESLDLVHLLALRNALLQVQWTALPCARVPEPDLPWGNWGALDDLDVPTYSTRREVLDAIKEFRSLALSGELTMSEVDVFLNTVEGYVR